MVGLVDKVLIRPLMICRKFNIFKEFYKIVLIKIGTSGTGNKICSFAQNIKLKRVCFGHMCLVA